MRNDEGGRATRPCPIGVAQSTTGASNVAGSPRRGPRPGLRCSARYQFQTELDQVMPPPKATSSDGLDSSMSPFFRI